MLGYLGVAIFVMIYTMVAKRLEMSVITAPMVFLGFGAFFSTVGMLPEHGTEAALHIVAELALIVILFLDAAKVDQAALLRRRVWPTRMLVIGLPLTFGFGFALGLLTLPGWSFAVVALAAAILVPTDAALGQPVVTNPDVPERPRRALTVESGLNDGFSLPLVLMMGVFAAPDAMAPTEGWLMFGIKQITLGPLVGGIIGAVGGVVLIWAKRTRSTSRVHEGIGALALAGAAYLAALEVGGSGFVATFAAGLAFGAIVRGRCSFVYEFTESEGQLLSWGAFFLLGAVLVPPSFADLTPGTLALILGSLFIVRPLAIWISLIGTDATTETRLFFGWFGPKGLATALFALIVIDQLDHDTADQVLHLAVNAVWISALLHGLTAWPGAIWYAKRMHQIEPAAEMSPVETSDEIFRERMKLGDGNAA